MGRKQVLVSTMVKIENNSKAFAWGLPAIMAAGFAGLLLVPVAQAQTPNQPAVDSSTGPAPVVDIVTPNSAGVSHNIYPDFNVYSNGVVLNNSTADGTAYLGVPVTANSNLASSGSASLILNEVTGTGGASLLAGVLEVFGGQADVIVANPNGVTCNGCSFYNTPRVTLTTGTPNLDSGTGALTGFTVDGTNTSNEIIIGDPGATSSYVAADVTGLSSFDVIARSIKVYGMINDSSATPQSEVGLVAGRNNYNYSSREATALSNDDTNKPIVGIDSGALGGAYAGKITLVSTESGVGINTPSDMTAVTGGINISADGKIVFGKAKAEQGNITATSIADAIDINGQVEAQGNLTLTAAGAVTVSSAGSAHSTQGSTVLAGSFSNSGTFSSDETIDIETLTGDLTNDGLISGRTLKLTAAATLSNRVNSRLESTGAEFTISAQDLANEGEIDAATTLDAAVTDGLTNSGAVSGQVVKLAAFGLLYNQAGGHVTSSAGMTLSGHTLSNAGSIGAGTTLDVNNTTDLVNTGQMAANGTLTASLSGDLTNTNSISGESVDMTADGTVTNDTGASVTSGTGGTSLRGGTLTNRGSIYSDGATSVAATAGDLTNTGSISGESLQASASGTLANEASGQITSTAGMELSAGTLTNAGNIDAGTTFGAMVTGDLVNTGYITAEGDASFDVGGTLTNGTLLTPTDATIHAGGTLNIDAGALNNYGGFDYLTPRGEISGMYLNITTGGDVQNSGNLFATGDVIIVSYGNVSNSFGWIKAGNYISVTAAGNFDNIVGRLQAPDGNFSAQSMQNAVLVRPDDELLLPKKHRNVIRAITAERVAQAVASWDKAVLARFGVTDTKVLDTIRLQLGDTFLMQQQQQQQQKKQGKGASNLPKPGKGASVKYAGAAAGARASAY
jgi:filamentous hemagglutinin